MKCADFTSHIYEFIEKELESDLIDEMEQHIKECSHCEKIYTQKKALHNKFTEAFQNSNIEFKSSRKIIMEKVRKEGYKSNLSRRIYLNFKGAWPVYISAAAVIALIVVMPKAATSGLKKTASMSSNTAAGTQKAYYDTANMADGQTRSAGSINVIGDREKVNAILEEIKKQPIGAVAPKIAYADEENVAFYNDRYLLLYRNTQVFKGIYSIIDFKDLNLGTMKGSPLIEVKASPNGQYYIISSLGAQKDIKNNNMYLVDMLSRRSMVIETDVRNSKSAFTGSSNYLAVANFSRGTINIFNTKDFSVESVKLDNLVGEWMDSIYISENKDVLVKAGPNIGYIFRRNNNYRTKEIKSQENLISITEDGFITYRDGALYILGDNKNQKLKDIGKEYSLMLSQGENVIFKLDYKAIKAYNLQSGKFYEFNVEKIKNATLSSNVHFNTDYSLIQFDSFSVANKNGELINLPTDSLLSGPVLLNDGTIYIQFSKDMKLGKFTIYKYDVTNKSKTVLYDSTK